MSRDLPPQYNPKDVEEKIYRKWEKSGFFNPDTLPRPKNHKLKAGSYCITVPPPNVTGSLHMGHALNAVIQDILIRKKRMEGYKTLWVPGTDHAGIATQNVVEKELKKEGKNRYDLGRAQFLKRIWEWKEQYGNIILDQFKKIGASMNWSRTRFTMDTEYQKAVEHAFVHYFKQGWIYRKERVINWCSHCQTSLSDLELEYQEVQSVLYYIKYPLVESKECITVATVRPETMLGDAAVAVNPKDKRYKDLIGKMVILPLQQRTIPIIADEKIDMEFGTGAVKVTPAHDLIDAEIGEKHALPFYKIIDERARMTKETGKLCEGLKTFECRDRVVAELKRQNLIEKEEPYRHNISICYRCGTVIEPIPSMQWFLKMGGLAKKAIRAVEQKKVRFHPKHWETVYFNWLKNVKDWTISRQIWWGHRIPAALCASCGEILIQPKIKARWFLIRHGETDWNREQRIQGYSAKTPLNGNGKSQAEYAAQELAQYPIDMIISSDQPRALETASIIGKKLGVRVEVDKELRERNYGLFEGRSIDEISKDPHLADMHKNGLREYDFTPPEGGESHKMLEERAWSAFKKYSDDTHYRNKNIVFVSHGGTIKAILRKLRNASFESHKNIFISHASPFSFIITDACKNCKNAFAEEEKDVLDTWFSSALWPFASLGWPQSCNTQQERCNAKKGTDLNMFYPTQALSTARDIINLWVARMVFSGFEFMGKEPFRNIIIHATILTKEGKRMSKSLGTGVDPMNVISKYGADAARFGLIWQYMGNQDIHWSEEHVIAGKKFCNKIWNAARFTIAQLPASSFQPPAKLKPKTVEDKRILAALGKTEKEVSRRIENYEFGHALHALYDFFWHAFCDQYLETSKAQMKNDKTEKTTQEVLAYVLTHSLILLHPFLPFITEELWEHMPIENKNLLIIENWPYKKEF